MTKTAADVSRQTGKSKSPRLGLGSYEIPGAITFSRKKFRTEFFHELNNIDRGVAITLYQKAFFQFVRLAWSQFPQAVPPPVSARLADKNFLSELEQVIMISSTLPYNAESKSIHPAFIELLHPAFARDAQLVINYPREKLLEELLQPLRELSDAIQSTFNSWGALQKIKKAKPVCESIIEWSKYWNLDADWCRDYAVAALCEWLADRWVQWEISLNPSQLSFSKAIFAVSREDIWMVHRNAYYPTEEGKAKRMSLLIQNFNFTWKGLDFQHYRWNVLSSYRSNWAHECSEAFKSYLAQRKKNGGTVPIGAMLRFRAARDSYLRKVEQAAKKSGLVKTPRHWAREHLTWAVLFQIQKWPLSKIEKTYTKPRKTIADGINRTIRFLGLQRRPDLPAGMPKGTRLRAERRIVRN